MTLDTVNIWVIVKRNYLMIVILTAVCTSLMGFMSIYYLPKQYEATATLLVKPENTGNQITYDELMTNEKLVSTYSVIIKSRTVAREVIFRLNLNMSEKELLKKVTVKGIEESLVTAISVRAYQADQAVELANAFAHSFQYELPGLMRVENVSILDQAELEDSIVPVSPKPIFLIGAMFFLSLNIGVGIALAKAVFDKSLRTEEEVQELLGIPVLVIVPHYPQR